MTYSLPVSRVQAKLFIDVVEATTTSLCELSIEELYALGSSLAKCRNGSIGQLYNPHSLRSMCITALQDKHSKAANIAVVDKNICTNDSVELPAAKDADAYKLKLNTRRTFLSCFGSSVSG